MELARRAQPWLGTLVEIVLGKNDDSFFESAFSQIAEVHKRMSYHADNSDLADLRRSAPGISVTVSSHTVAVLRLAKRLYHETAGLFDISVGRKLVATGCLPRVDGRHLTYFNGGVNDIEVVDDTHVRCHRPILIDLGGIAKGYAVDLAIASLTQSGCTYAVVNAGGDLRHIGSKPETIWLRGANGIVSYKLQINNMAVATSSNLLFRRVSRGVSVSPHIGRDHKPLLVDTATTVIAPECAFADAMTKVGMADSALAEKMLNPVGGSLITIPNQEDAT